MDLTPEDVERALPPGLPPRGLIDEGLEKELGALYLGPNSQMLERSMLWAAALQTAFERSGIWTRVPGFDFATYGFLRRGGGSTEFGVLVHIRRRLASQSSDGPMHGFQLAELFVGDLAFPVVVSEGGRGTDQAGYSPVHPTFGTAACRVALEDEDGEHILTCAHVLDGALPNAKVDLTLGQLWKKDCQGTVSKVGPPRVDAATVRLEDADLIISLVSEIGAMPIVPPGLEVKMRGQASGVISTVVSDVSHPRLMNKGNYGHVEFLVFLSDSGRSGDSGALVESIDARNGAVALYLGDAVAVDGSMIGRCQLMAQVQYCLRISQLLV